jgi:hypothetical protein
MELYTKKSSAQENEEALNSDDGMPLENDENGESPNQSGDEDDYVSMDDEETAEEAPVSVESTVSSEVAEETAPPKTEKDSARKPSSAKLAEAAHETEDQAVPNVTVEANGATILSTHDADFEDDIELWSDVEAELTNDGLGISDEERALLSDDELAAVDNVCADDDCPLKKTRLEEKAAITKGI